MTGIQLMAGFPEEQKSRVAQLFWDAFAGKLGRVLRPDHLALAFIESALTREFAISAVTPAGDVVGIAGFKTREGGLISTNFTHLSQTYGRFGALWRGVLLDLTERPIAEGQLLADGIFVAAEARGQGVGRLLLDGLLAEAARRGCQEVRLDVIDTNPRARGLYEREGFQAIGEERTGPLRHIFGFTHATTMTKAVPRRLQRDGPPASQSSERA